MNLLAGVNYDPTGAAAVSKATTALLAMTALDTTNLRVTFTVPLSGRVWVRISGGGLHGAATYPIILVGILSGATVVARHQPIVTIGGAAAATTPGQVFCEFLVPGLTPGTATTWDLAYGVEQIVALTGWKYGGPNNSTTAGDAFGGISFEVYDPNPIYLPGVMPTATVQANQATLQTTDTAIKAKTDSLTFTTAGKVDASILAAADFAQGAADKVWSTAARTLSSFGTLAADVWAVATRTLTAASDSSGVTTLLARITGTVPLASDYTAARALKLDNLDATVSSRGTSTYAGGAVASVTGNVGGNVVGSVGSVSSYGTLVADVATAVWAAGARTLTAFGTLAADVWAVATRTITGGTIGTYTGNTPQTGDSFARLGAPAGASLSADVAAVKADTASTGTKATDIQSRLPAALTGGRMESNVGAMSSGTVTAAALATDAALEISATVWDESAAGHTTAGTTGKALTTAAAAAAPSAATVAAAVWNEALAGHATAGSAGAALSAAGTAGDPWTTPLPGAYAAGTAGKIIGTNLDAAVSSRASSTALTAAVAPLATSTDVAAVETAIGAPATGTVTDDIAAIQGSVNPPTRRR